MPRPPLPIGTWGKISTTTAKGTHTARARFRDFDGETRWVERSSTKSKGNAEDLLREALRDRAKPAGDDLTAESTVRAAGDKWWADEIDGSDRAYNTIRRYREALDIVNLGLGGVRLREVSTARLDAFLRATTSNRGAATAKVCKTVLNGLLGLAARLDAISSNPLRDVGRIKKPKQVEKRFLGLDEMRLLRMLLRADKTAVRGDLPDPIDAFLGTGARIGEVLALRWTQVDLDAAVPTVTITATTLWKMGVGMTIQEYPKSDDSNRTLVLPRFVVATLLARERTSELVFPSSNGNVRDPSNLRKQWRHFVLGSEYEGVTPHTFRRSVANYIEQIEDASGQLGHSDTAVTKKHYRKKTRTGPDLRSELDAIGDPTFTPRKQTETGSTTGIQSAPRRRRSAS